MARAQEFHGHRHTPEYEIWKSIKQRCLNPKSKRFVDYGERGITICDRWRNSFTAFIEDMGPRPVGPERYTMERVNNDGNYEPGNCRWATYFDQANNSRKNIRPLVIAAGFDPATHKRCCTCKQILPRTDFSPMKTPKRTRTHDGLRYDCKTCKRGQAAIARAKRRETAPQVSG